MSTVGCVHGTVPNMRREECSEKCKERAGGRSRRSMMARPALPLHGGLIVVFTCGVCRSGRGRVPPPSYPTEEKGPPVSTRSRRNLLAVMSAYEKRFADERGSQMLKEVLCRRYQGIGTKPWIRSNGTVKNVSKHGSAFDTIDTRDVQSGDD